MVAVQVFGNDTAVAFAGTQGNFQLNVYKPVLLHNLLASIRLLLGAQPDYPPRKRLRMPGHAVMKSC